MSTATIPAQLEVRVAIDRPARIRDYEIKMLAAVARYEVEKAEYDAVQAAYDKPGRMPEVAKGRANGDPRSADAARRAEWFRSEAAMYAAVVTALRGEPR